MSVHTIQLGHASTTELAVTVVVDHGATWSLFERETDTGEIRTLTRGESDTYAEAVSDAAWWHARRCASYSETSDAYKIHAEIMRRATDGGAS